MRRFNRGYSLLFLAITIIALAAVLWTHQQVEGKYQAETRKLAEYTIDDWIAVLRLDELLGEPAVTPIPYEQLFPKTTPTPTAAPEA